MPGRGPSMNIVAACAAGGAAPPIGAPPCGDCIGGGGCIGGCIGDGAGGWIGGAANAVFAIAAFDGCGGCAPNPPEPAGCIGGCIGGCISRAGGAGCGAAGDCPAGGFGRF